WAGWLTRHSSSIASIDRFAAIFQGTFKEQRGFPVKQKIVCGKEGAVTSAEPLRVTCCVQRANQRNCGTWSKGRGEGMAVALLYILKSREMPTVRGCRIMPSTCAAAAVRPFGM